MHAIVNQIKKETATGKADNLRAQVDAQLVQLYEMTGSKTLEARVLGEKVGTWSVSKKGGETTQELFVQDRDAFEKWVLAEGKGHEVERVVHEVLYDERAVLDEAMAEGEVPDGCSVLEHEEPVTYRTTLRGVSWETVSNALKVKGALADGVVASALLEGGVE